MRVHLYRVLFNTNKLIIIIKKYISNIENITKESERIPF